MSNPKALSITLPQDLADLVEAKVKSGEFANDSAVVAEGLRIIADHDLSIEEWLVDEVVPTYDAMAAARQTALTAEETWVQLEQHMGIIADQDRVFEKWMIDEVLPTVKAHDADPGRAISVEDMRHRMQAHADKRKSEKTIRE